MPFFVPSSSGQGLLCSLPREHETLSHSGFDLQFSDNTMASIFFFFFLNELIDYSFVYIFGEVAIQLLCAIINCY